jgi:CheY-like chemotaxis protein
MCVSIITDKIYQCDLHMPNKDGYQTCKDIRRWERRNGHQHLPIIALSANVLGDVYSKCVEACFNSYVTKPVDFKELGTVLMKFLDPPPEAKGRVPEFMKPKHEKRR